jgi:hypothetical protein
VNAVTAAIKAESVALLAQQILGVKPEIENVGDYYRVYWNKEDLPEVRENLDEYISNIKPGDVRVEFIPVVQNVAIKKVLPYVLGIFAAGFLIGKL